MGDDGVHWDYSQNSNNMFAGGSMLVSSKVGLAVGILTVVVATVCGWWWHYVLLRESKARTSSNKKAPLPPGSLGLPLLGETLEFLLLTQADKSAEFLNPRVAKYGQMISFSVSQKALNSGRWNMIFSHCHKGLDCHQLIFLALPITMPSYPVITFFQHWTQLYVRGARTWKKGRFLHTMIFYQ